MNESQLTFYSFHIHFYSQYSMNYIPYLKPRKVHSLTMMKFEGCNPRRQELNGGILTFPLVTSTHCRWLAIFGRISFATGGNGDGREGACSTHFMANSGGTKKLRAGVLHQKVSKTGWRTIHIKGVGFFGATHCSDMTELTDCKNPHGGQVLKRTPMQPTSREPLRSMGVEMSKILARSKKHHA